MEAPGLDGGQGGTEQPVLIRQLRAGPPEARCQGRPGSGRAGRHQPPTDAGIQTTRPTQPAGQRDPGVSGGSRAAGALGSFRHGGVCVADRLCQRGQHVAGPLNRPAARGGDPRGVGGGTPAAGAPVSHRESSTVLARRRSRPVSNHLVAGFSEGLSPFQDAALVGHPGGWHCSMFHARRVCAHRPVDRAGADLCGSPDPPSDAP